MSLVPVLKKYPHQPIQKRCPVELLRSGTCKSMQWNKDGTAAILGNRRWDDQDTEEQKEDEGEEVG